MELRPLSAAERADWLRLLRTENVGPVTFYQLMMRFGTADKAVRALPDLAKRGGRNGALRGHAGLFARPSLAIVGARNASLNARKLAEQIARDCAAEGVLIVSGLARGIDGAAHTGALSAPDGGTAGVIAGGIDVVYPPEHAGLQEEIATRGALIAEMPPGTQPQARHFPRRNRIISGMAQAVLVVEAAVGSGSLITARMAGDQGRDVFAIPGSPLDPRARGGNQLLKDGAQLVESAEDVLALLRSAAVQAHEPDPDLFSFARPSAGIGGSGNGYDPTGLVSPPGGAALGEADLTAARRTVVEMLGPSPVSVDELIRQCQISPAIVQLIILELELGGRLERHAGHRVSLLMA